MNEAIEDAVEAAEAVCWAWFRVGFRVLCLLDGAAQLNPAYRISRDAVLDTVLGPAEDFESAPLTTRSRA